MAEKLTRAQVFNAADAISKAGQAPTVAGVRAKLGTGSYTTITAMLREWKEQANEAEEEVFEVPEVVTEALGRAAEIVWKAAQDHFARELATMKRDAERSVASALAQVSEAMQEIAGLEQSLEDTVSDNVRVTQALTAAQNAALAAATEIVKLETELTAQRERIAEQSDLLRRLTCERTTQAPDDPKTPEPPKAPKRKTTPSKVTQNAVLEVSPAD